MIWGVLCRSGREEEGTREKREEEEEEEASADEPCVGKTDKSEE